MTEVVRCPVCGFLTEVWWTLEEDDECPNCGRRLHEEEGTQVLIYKYGLSWGREQTIDANITKPLTVSMQNGRPYLWAETAPSPTCAKLTVFCVATGEEVPHNSQYIGTVFVDVYVWHFYYQV